VLLAVIGRVLLALEEITELLANERQHQRASHRPEAVVADAIADEKLLRAQSSRGQNTISIKATTASAKPRFASIPSPCGCRASACRTSAPAS
jgi:hypothetical protein